MGGKFLRVFRSLKVAARKYNILPNNLSTAASGKAAYCGKYQWRLVCNGKIPRRLPALPPLTLPALQLDKYSTQADNWKNQATALWELIELFWANNSLTWVVGGNDLTIDQHPPNREKTA